jgi:4-amino-4-deoxy-L-arabinose transferase-like glycosyltransferase
VIDALAVTLIAASLALAAWGLLMALLGRRPGMTLLAGLGVLEVLALVQAVVAVVAMITGDRPEQLAVFLLYLVASLLVAPIGALWMLAERSRWGNVVGAITCLVLAILVVRLQQIW